MQYNNIQKLAVPKGSSKIVKNSNLFYIYAQKFCLKPTFLESKVETFIAYFLKACWNKLQVFAKGDFSNSFFRENVLLPFPKF
jgi:hypothetical protein